MYEILKFVHITSVILWAGGSVMFLVLNGRKTRESAEEVRRVAEQSLWLGNRYYTPVAVIAAVSGIWMVIYSGIGFEHLWITIGIGVVVISAALGMAFYARQAKAIIEGVQSEGLSEKVAARAQRIATVARLETLLLFFAVYAMVAKLGD